MGLADLGKYFSSVRIAGRGRFLAVRAELNEETIMSFRNDRFNEGTLSLDKLAGEIDLGKSRAVSDGGRGAEMIRGALDLKEIQAGEKRMADERQKRVRRQLDKMREYILNANLAEATHGKEEKKSAKSGRRDYNNQKRAQAQKEALIKLFDLMRTTGGGREETILRLSMALNMKKRSAERFYDRGVALLKMLFTLENKG